MQVNNKMDCTVLHEDFECPSAVFFGFTRFYIMLAVTH